MTSTDKIRSLRLTIKGEYANGFNAGLEAAISQIEGESITDDELAEYLSAQNDEPEGLDDHWFPYWYRPEER